MQHLYRYTILQRLHILCLAFFALLPTTATSDVMIQGFYWDVPSPAANTPRAIWWWDKLAQEAAMLKRAGFTSIWIPPVTKGASGGFSVGYDPFDDYDLGSKDQRGTVPTRYGTREQLHRTIATLRANGLAVYVDLVQNHRNGDNGDQRFQYRDALGRPNGGRFAKGPGDFHPDVPQDPNVPEEDSSFGRDVAHVNGKKGYIGRNLNIAGDWLTRSLDVQGYRIDYVKGISTDWLREFLDYGAMKQKFVVGEFYDYNLDKVHGWVRNSMNNRVSAFDFPLRGLLKQMCDARGAFNMRRLDRAGLAARDPFRAVTWVENHDTDRHEPIVRNKMLAYAYILTAEGYPCVYWRDYSEDKDCYKLKKQIDPLVWVHENLAQGTTRERWKDDDVFTFEREGGRRLLVGLNDNETASKTITVATGFGANRRLKDYVGHSGEVQTDQNGRVTITIPSNATGNGYVCYAPVGLQFARNRNVSPVTQEWLGALDLDISPADPNREVTICRVWVAQGKRIVATIRADKTAWTAETRLRFQLLDPDNQRIGSQIFGRNTPQGIKISLVAPKSGWHTFKVRANDTPTANPMPSYRLQVTYTAPLEFTLR